MKYADIYKIQTLEIDTHEENIVKVLGKKKGKLKGRHTFAYIHLGRTDTHILVLILFNSENSSSRNAELQIGHDLCIFFLNLMVFIGGSQCGKRDMQLYFWYAPL